jgi:multidrug transporter EmrE-like cation transporter
MSGAPGASISGVIWALILTGVGLNAAAQLLLKVATRPLSAVTGFGVQTLIDSGMILVKSGTFWAGMVCYGASLCVWLAALSKAPVSTAYPMLSLGYIVVAVISFFRLRVRPSMPTASPRWPMFFVRANWPAVPRCRPSRQRSPLPGRRSPCAGDDFGDLGTGDGAGNCRRGRWAMKSSCRP